MLFLPKVTVLGVILIFHIFIQTNSIEAINSERVLMPIASHHVTSHSHPNGFSPFCQPAKFRTIDGSCNNIFNPEWGKARTPYGRFLLPDYSDGFNLPRRAKDGFPLPSAREVSLSIARDLPFDHPRLTHLFTLFGQFLNHEVTNKPDTKGSDDESLDCCDKDRLHPECFPIKVPSDDKYYVAQGVKCINLARSIPFKYPDHVARKREQVNNNTAFIDASTVYGSDFDTAAQLRSFVDGKLRITEVHGRELPPEDFKQCDADKCFKAGDFRANMLPALTSVHTLWLRQHNRLAEGLKKINQHWNDERIYQEARKIIGAMLQHIVYKEYLTKIFSTAYRQAWELNLLPTGSYAGYDARISPGIANSFAAAALRFGHTMVRPRFHRVTASGIIAPSPLLSKEFDNAVPLHHSELEPIVRGMLTQHARDRDHFFTSQLTEHLFENKTKPGSGQDLFAINIQRGRDNGIPGYTAWRKFCNLPDVTTFEDLKGIVPDDVAYAFQHLYDQVSDVDLYPAGVSEYPVNGGLLGPTFSCIIANQFRNLRKGDQFWYENGNHPGAFTRDQLNAIRQISFARIICDNTDSISMIQADVFQKDNHTPRLSCESDHLPRFDLKPWEEDTVFGPGGYPIPPNSIHQQPPLYHNNMQYPPLPNPYHQLLQLQSPHQHQQYNEQYDKPYRKPQDKPYQEPLLVSKPYNPYEQQQLNKPYEKPRLNKPYEKPHADKPYEKPYVEKPYETPHVDKPYEKPHENKPYEKPFEDKPYEQPHVDKPHKKPHLDEAYEQPQLNKPYELEELKKPYEETPQHVDKPYEESYPSTQEYQPPKAQQEAYKKPGISSPSAQQMYHQGDKDYQKPASNYDQKHKQLAVQAYRPGGDYYVIPGYVYPMFHPSYGMYQLPYQGPPHINYTPSYAFRHTVPAPAANFIPPSLMSLYAHQYPNYPWFG